MHNIKYGISLFKKTIKILTNRERRTLVLVYFVMLLSSVFELLGVSAILPFVEAIINPEELMKKKFIAEMCNVFNVHSVSGVISMCGALIAVLYIVKNVYLVWAYNIQYSFASVVQKNLGVDILKSYLNRPYEFFLNVNSADIIRSCYSDVSQYYTTLSNIITLMTECLTVSIIGVYLIIQDPGMAILALVVLGIVLLLIVVAFKPISKKTGRAYRAAGSLLNKAILQTVHGIKEINVNRRKKYFLDRFEDASDKAQYGFKVNSIISSSTDRIVEGLCVAGLMLVVCIRINGMSATSEIVPKLAIFAMGAFRIMPSVGKISSRINSIVFYADSVNNIYSQIEFYGRNNNYSNICMTEEKESGQSPDKERITFDNEIRIDNICWHYQNSSDNVLSMLNLDIHRGEAIALIGASGAGKTTLADAILGLLKPQSGIIMSDGYSIFDNPEGWAQVVGYVPQSVYLMDDTIRENILFGLPKDDESDDKIWKALEVAQLKDFVKGQPKGLDTMVGERGVRFSGGQRQRIAIARAIYNNPELLVLDEATAALDNETEAAVMEAIETLHGKMTLVIVAHRLETIRSCDAIYEINNGVAIKRTYDEVFG